MMEEARGLRARSIAFALLAAAVVAVALVGAPSAPAISLTATTVPQVTGPIPSTTSPGDPSHDYIFYSTPRRIREPGREGHGHARE